MSETWALLLTQCGILSRNWIKTVLVACLVVSACIWMLIPFESALMKSMSSFRNSPMGSWLNLPARTLSEYGDFLGLNVTLIVGFGMAAALRRSRFLRLTMLACVLSTTLSGGIANALRATLGRARPNAKMEPGFYGPTLSARFHSCPSGHTATAFGGTIPIAIAAPQIGIPLAVVAGSVAWSRFHNRAHHPSDIIFSMTLASIIGIPLGMAVRRLGGPQQTFHGIE
jgi:membrane-associated phospholipid phosphatase